MNAVIHWFRRDLRLTDNNALYAALASGDAVIPLFIFDERIIRSERSGTARMAFLLKALHTLDGNLRQHNSRLLIRFGEPTNILRQLVRDTKAQAIYFNKDYSPAARKRDEQVTHSSDVPVYAYDDALLLAPGTVMKDDGTPYTVFTPFKKRWLTLAKTAVADELPHGTFHSLDDIEGSAMPTLRELGFDTTMDVPDASESAGQKLLHKFLAASVYQYNEGRNRLAFAPHQDDVNGSSFLSAYFHLGLLSIRQAYWSAREAYQIAPDKMGAESVETWVSELIWREFYNHILFHFPQVVKHNFRREYDDAQWRYAPDELQAWKDGRTGYPVVDAAMRQLNATGWMPNRARMIVASFLCKDLLIDWREGELYFMQRLIDGDTAANNGGWQWTAGTGTDAQPYFRIFNPVSQSQKFDPDGTYIRRWLPELRDIRPEHFHAPWLAPTPSSGYPSRLVDHEFARQRTLQAFKVLS